VKLQDLHPNCQTGVIRVVRIACWCALNITLRDLLMRNRIERNTVIFSQDIAMIEVAREPRARFAVGNMQKCHPYRIRVFVSLIARYQPVTP
jgi:hypothetical protein